MSFESCLAAELRTDSAARLALPLRPETTCPSPVVHLLHSTQNSNVQGKMADQLTGLLASSGTLSLDKDVQLI